MRIEDRVLGNCVTVQSPFVFHLAYKVVNGCCDVLDIESGSVIR